MKRTISLVTAVLCGIGIGIAAGAGAAVADPGPWSVVTLPLPADANTQHDVTIGKGACGAPGQCVIPGSYVTARNATQGLLVTVNDGVATSQTLPAPAGAPTDPRMNLLKAACKSGGTCVAVGNYELATGQNAGVLAWQTGSGWHVIAAPVPAAQSGHLVRIYDVACAGQVCFAVGRLDQSVNHSLPLVERFANGTWTPTALTPPAGETGLFDLETIACSSARRCVAVGPYSPSSKKWGPLLGATWDGTSWTTSSLAQPTDAARRSYYNQPDASACAPGGTCHVLAPYPPLDKSVQYRPADYANDGTQWTTTRLPDGDPPATYGTHLNSVQCVAADSCVAVGLGQAASGATRYGVIATLSVAGWSLTYAPGPTQAPHANVWLSALSCLPDGTCTAFGLYGAINKMKPIATTTSGTPTTTALPLPANYLNFDDRITTAVYDGTRQLVAANFSTGTSTEGALWIRTA